MTEKQKKQIDVCRENGLTISAIADVTGLSVSAIKSYCSRRNEAEPPSDFHCKFCGAALMQTEKHREKHFCNQSCYFRWRYAQGDIKRTVYQKKCAHCGKPFTAASKKEQKYCSCACFYAARKVGGERE
ncbi:MAG: RNA polymerase subunit sigma-70 [Clostridia bacterium]|nr:RNA polymerase subunit sigma-70 [Clostridia bacterium]